MGLDTISYLHKKLLWLLIWDGVSVSKLCELDIGLSIFMRKGKAFKWQVVSFSALHLDIALSEEIAQSTVYHHLRQICVDHHFTTPQSATKTTRINVTCTVQ